jgi:hypothetical protein
VLRALEEAHALPRGIAGAVDGDRVQSPGLDVGLDAAEVEVAREERFERAVVEQRDALVLEPRAEEKAREPAAAVAEGLSTHNVVRLEVAPHFQQVDGAPSRGAHRERPGIPAPAEVRDDQGSPSVGRISDRLQHADLTAARAAAREHGPVFPPRLRETITPPLGRPVTMALPLPCPSAA